MDFQIENNTALNRFQTTVDGEVCVADYRITEGVLTLTHTGVPPQLGGRGIAGALVQAVLDHARADGLKVRPACSYAAAYMKKRPETADLMA